MPGAKRLLYVTTAILAVPAPIEISLCQAPIEPDWQR
jgi:hypothetical protein